MKILISTGGGNGINYIRAVEAAGGSACACYLPAPDLSYDGLILSGGGDVEPHRFGQENCGTQETDPLRDEAELALLDAFLKHGKPVLAICRGHQVANVWAGGDLIQDLGTLNATHREEEEYRVHPIHAEQGSLLYELYGSDFIVNSSHHQAVGCPGRGMRVTARSADGVVEAMEHESLPLIMVQFHPERMTGEFARPDVVDGAKIFEHFLRLCRRS